MTLMGGDVGDVVAHEENLVAHGRDVVGHGEDVVAQLGYVVGGEM